MTKFVNFSTIKGMTGTKNFKKVMVGRQYVYINLERAAVLLTLRTTALSLNNLKMLRPKVTKNLTDMPKKFCETPPRCDSIECYW